MSILRIASIRQLLQCDTQRSGSFFERCFAGTFGGFDLCVSGLADPHAPGHFFLRQHEVFAPGLEHGLAVDCLAHHGMRCAILGDKCLVADEIGVRNDDKGGFPAFVVDGLVISKWFHRVFLPLQC